MRTRLGLTVGFLFAVACRGTTNDAGVTSRTPSAPRSRVPVELSVKSRDSSLRDVIRAIMEFQIRRDKGVALVSAEGDWRIEVFADYAEDGAAEDANEVVLSIQVVDCATKRRRLSNGVGQPTDSIVGGTQSSSLTSLWSTCAALVSDVSRFACSVRDDEHAADRLRAGETDLVDDDGVRQGDR